MTSMVDDPIIAEHDIKRSIVNIKKAFAKAKGEGVRRFMRETQNFERGGEPLKQIGIGQSHINQHIIDTTEWALRKEMWDYCEPKELIRDYRGFPILVLFDPLVDPKAESNMSATWIATSTVSYTNWSSSKFYVINKMKQIIDELLDKGGNSIKNAINKFRIKHGDPIIESQNFTRGGDPLKQMDIGHAAKIERLKNSAWDWSPGKFDSIEDEHIMDIIEYRGYLIKVASLLFMEPDPFGGDKIVEKYYITSNVGEEYPSTGPTLHKSKDEIPDMIAGEKKWIDEYLESK